MPTDSDPKTSGESQHFIQGLLAKCGIVIPTLSVRDSEASSTGPNRPVMFIANSKEKKRKRTSDSPLSSARAPFKMAGTRGDPHGDNGEITETVEQKQQRAKEIFEKHLSGDYTMNEGDIKGISQKNIEKPQTRRHTPRVSAKTRSSNTPLQIFEKRREALVRSEEEDAWDYGVRNPKSVNETMAAFIIREIREYERLVLFGNVPSEAIPDKDALDMGGQFLTNRARIEQQSKLFEIARAVPKGSILHLHFNAELNPERLLQEARLMDNMYVWSIQPLLTKEDLAVTEVIFNILPAGTTSNDIFSDKYQGQERNWRDADKQNLVWMKWTEFRTRFGDMFPGFYMQTGKIRAAINAGTCSEGEIELDPAENWIKSKMVLSTDEAYDPKQTVNGVWARFNQATRCFKGLLNYKRVYKWYIGNAIDRMIDEKIMYAELRPMLLDKFIPDDDGIQKIDNAAQMQLIIDAVNAKKKELDEQNQGHKFPYGLKIIYCTPRSIPKPLMRKEMLDCINLKIQYPNLICGFDLVGAEDRPNHIGYYYEELVAFQETCERMDLEIPFLFHAGETLLDTGGSSDPRNSNLYDAVLLKSKRIGHGFSLMKHPALLKYFKKGPLQKDEFDEGDQSVPIQNPGICIELCPISNELLHLCRNIKEHPYPELLAAGIPCTVNSDNPSLFSNSMSHEFYQVMVGAPTMSLYSWKQLALWSIEYSCLKPDEQAECKKHFATAWDDFCDLVVEKYGHLINDTKINKDVADQEYGTRRIS